MNQRTKGILKYYIQPTVLCIGLAYALGSTPWMKRLENVPLDLITQYRIRYQKPVDPRVVTVGIDDGSIEDNGRWPWDRTVHAKFSESISYGKPACVSWDILFPEKSKNEQDDTAFQEAARKLNGRMVFSAFQSDEAPRQDPPIIASNLPITRIEGDLSRLPTAPFAMRPITKLQSVGLTAFADTPASEDGVRRHVPMLQNINGQVQPSLSLQTLMVYGQIEPSQVRVVLGEAIYL